MAAPERVIIISARYSDNLGDGVIGDSIAWMLGRLRPSWTVEHFDLAGRTAFHPRNAASLSSAKRIFYALPMPLRAYATLCAWPFRHRRRVQAAWNAKQSSVDYRAIIAGGQLVADTALNFPLKLGLLSRLLANDAAPTAIYATGVSGAYSNLGKRLFQQAFDRLDLRWLGARDTDSLENLFDNFSIAHCTPRRTVDPAIWAAEAYGITKTRNERRRIGIGIAHPLEISAHTPTSRGVYSEDTAQRFIESLVSQINARGMTPVLFNNGSAEDQLFTDQIATRLRMENAAAFDVAPRPTTPAELTNNISGFDVVVAHRLHANIIAFSLGIPTIGMRWDRKVQSFFAETGRSEYCIDSGAAETLDLIESSMSEQRAGRDAARLAELRTFAMTELELLAQAIEA